jgi:hypothetical protein
LREVKRLVQGLIKFLWRTSSSRLLFVSSILYWVPSLPEEAPQYLVADWLVFESRFVQNEFQLPAVKIGDPEGLHQACIFASFQGLSGKCQQVKKGGS